MARKRVPISLRKPPSPERVEAFVRGEIETPESAESAPESGPRQASVAERTDEVAEAGKATEPEVFGEVRLGPEGVPLRPLTIYLPAAFAEELALHCADRGRDVSGVIREALEAHMRHRLAPGAAPGPEPGEAGAAEAREAREAREPFGRRAARGRDFARQRAILSFLDGALRVLEVGQSLALRLRVQLQRA